MPQTNSYQPWLCIEPETMARRYRLTTESFRQTLYSMENQCWIEPLQFFGIEYRLTIRVSLAKLYRACPSHQIRLLNQLLESSQLSNNQYQFHLFRQATSLRQDPERLDQLCKFLASRELADLKLSGEIIRTRLLYPGDFESILISGTATTDDLQKRIIASPANKDIKGPAIF